MIPLNRFVIAKRKSATQVASGQTSVVKSSGATNAMKLDEAVAIKVFSPILILPGLFKVLIPDISTKNGNLFNDRFDKNTLWYLPVFNLLPGTDSDFSFIATQSALPNHEGDSFYSGDLKFTVHKDIPADALNAKTSNPALNLQEIPLQSLQITLSTSYADEHGQEAHTSFTGTIAATNNGNYEIHVSNIFGDPVVILFENLKITGSLQVALSATYSAWRPAGTSKMFFLKTNVAANNVKARQVDANFREARYQVMRPQQPPKPDAGFNENETFYQTLSIDKKYNGNEYQLSYTIKTNTGTRPIIDVADLKNLNGNPNEFSQLKIIPLDKYPTIGSLYIGVLSRVIIIIPQSYAIVRNALTCSASCLASVDTTPGGNGNCMFQFQFELTPDVNPFDFNLLSKEIQQHPELQSYTLKFATSLNDQYPSVINSVFTTDTSYSPSATPENFYMTTTVVDKPGQSAIVNANLFIQQLCSMSPGCGLGTINLKLEDNFPNPVSTTVILSLPSARSDDGISWTVNADTQLVTLTNTTSFTFLLRRYAFNSDAGIGEPVDHEITIASGESANIPLPANFEHLSVILDFIEQRNGPVNRTDISDYMEIKVQDAQNVQYYIGINSSQVKYATKNIKQIDIEIHLATDSPINVPHFSVMNQNTAAGTKIMLPLQFVVSSLPATISFVVSFTDATKPSVSFTKQNDFIINPVFDVIDADIPP